VRGADARYAGRDPAAGGIRTVLASTIRFAPRSTHPTLTNTAALRDIMEREALDAGQLMFNYSKET
jgi:hypothetical protein